MKEEKRIIYAITSSVVEDTSYVVAQSPTEAVSNYCLYWFKGHNKVIRADEILTIEKIGEAIQ